jgi:hypothetical protein
MTNRPYQNNSQTLPAEIHSQLDSSSPLFPHTYPGRHLFEEGSHTWILVYLSQGQLGHCEKHVLCRRFPVRFQRLDRLVQASHDLLFTLLPSPHLVLVVHIQDLLKARLDVGVIVESL